jgi:glutathione S-transferase
MTHILGTLMSAAVTILIVLFYFATIIEVGRQRGKHGVKAPSCSGPPAFDCAYRVQMNTLEQMGLMLPLFWVATVFPPAPAPVVPLVGIVWIIGRILYMAAYLRDPAKRGPGMAISMLCTLVLLILAITGVIRTWLALTAGLP